jgi:hypothetical protein
MGKMGCRMQVYGFAGRIDWMTAKRKKCVKF